MKNILIYINVKEKMDFISSSYQHFRIHNRRMLPGGGGGGGEYRLLLLQKRLTMICSEIETIIGFIQ